MREKIREYINELDAEIDRVESDLEKQMTYNVEACNVTKIESRLNTIVEVNNDLLGRLEEVVQMEKKKIKAHRIGTCGTFCSNCNKSDARAFNQYIKYCWFCGAEFNIKK